MSKGTQNVYMNDAELLAYMNTDATKWAHELSLRLRRAYGMDISPHPSDLLHSWLANAIEAGRAQGFREAQAEQQQAEQDRT